MHCVPNSATESMFFIVIASKSEHDQETPYSLIADQTMAPRGRAIEH